MPYAYLFLKMTQLEPNPKYPNKKILYKNMKFYPTVNKFFSEEENL